MKKADTIISNIFGMVFCFMLSFFIVFPLYKVAFPKLPDTRIESEWVMFATLTTTLGLTIIIWSLLLINMKLNRIKEVSEYKSPAIPQPVERDVSQPNPLGLNE